MLGSAVFAGYMGQKYLSSNLTQAEGGEKNILEVEIDFAKEL